MCFSTNITPEISNIKTRGFHHRKERDKYFILSKFHVSTPRRSPAPAAGNYVIHFTFARFFRTSFLQCLSSHYAQTKNDRETRISRQSKSMQVLHAHKFSTPHVFSFARHARLKSSTFRRKLNFRENCDFLHVASPITKKRQTIEPRGFRSHLSLSKYYILIKFQTHTRSRLPATCDQNHRLFAWNNFRESCDFSLFCATHHAQTANDKTARISLSS